MTIGATVRARYWTEVQYRAVSHYLKFHKLPQFAAGALIRALGATLLVLGVPHSA